MAMRPARAFPGQRPTRPPTGRALLAKVVTPQRGMGLMVPSCAARTRPVRVGRCQEPLGRSRGGVQTRLDSARGACCEGRAP